jgi:N-acetylmuramoyl-L-alanine amidase
MVTTTVVPPTKAPTTAAPTTALPRFPLADDGRGRVLVTSTGVVLPILDQTLMGTVVRTPCQREATVGGGRVVNAAHVVLDPGHGGSVEPGSVGPNGVVEAELNLAVAVEVRRLLEAEGLTVVLTREGDYELPIITRAEIVNGLQPKLFVSIHHNGAGTVAPRPTPGTEVYFQYTDAESKRLAGVLWEDVSTALATQPLDWVGLSDAGAIYRLDRDGSDFYGVLRRTAGTPAALLEAAYLSNPSEAEALGTDEFRQVEARAIAHGILRWLTTRDPGSGFNDPIGRGFASSGGGTLTGCKDPALS